MDATPSAVPRWLRDAGISAWLLAGIALLVVATVWVLSLTHTIVMPLLASGIIAAVAGPVVGWLSRHHLGRGGGAAIVLLAIMGIAAGMTYVILTGITSETDQISQELNDASGKIAGWLDDAGVDPNAAQDAKKNASDAVSNIVPVLLKGVGKGVEELASLVFFLSLTALSLFFLLKDGPAIRAWGERHMGVPMPVARIVTGRTLGALRGYFVGVTAIAVYNAVLVGGAALIIGVPLAGTIAAVTFIGAYIPYLGAWSAGAFSVLLALGGAGTEAALAMVVVQLLANGVLQQLVQPIAYGAALGIHPLAVLIVTIAGGCLFGAPGLILAAPATSAIVRITADLAEAREPAAPPGDPAPAPT